MKKFVSRLKSQTPKLISNERFVATTEKVSSKLKNYWATTVVAGSDASHWIAQTDWMKSFNENYASAVSKAMDSEYKVGAIDIETGLKMSANNHRILDDGHTVTESLKRAMEVGEQSGQTAMDSFTEWAKAYLTDLSSTAGMPVVPFGDDVYAILRALQVPDELARDLVTMNGQEAVEALLGGTIASVALIFSWKDEDKERFSNCLGSIGVGSLVAMNPATALIVVVGLAIGYNKQLVNKDGIYRGGLTSLTALSVSLIIPGPLLLGAIPAFVISCYVNKKLDRNIPVKDQMAALLAYLRSEEFKQLGISRKNEIESWFEARIISET